MTAPSRSNPYTDLLITVFLALPPAANLGLGVATALWGVYESVVERSTVLGTVLMMIGMGLTVSAIFVVVVDMRRHSFLRGLTLEQLMHCRPQDLQRVLTVYLQVKGYRVFPIASLIERNEDADLIATRKKETVLVQFNHWNESILGTEEVKGLERIGRRLGAASLLVHGGQASDEALDLAKRKQIIFLGVADILGEIAVWNTPDQVEAESGDRACDDVVAPSIPRAPVEGARKFFFINGGLARGHFDKLTVLLTTMPDAVAVFTSEKQIVLSEAQEKLTELHPRLIGVTPSISGASPDSRLHREPRSAQDVANPDIYQEIMTFLRWQPEGPGACWLAIDISPSGFPSGCQELLLVDEQRGLDMHSVELAVSSMKMLSGAKASTGLNEWR